MFSSNSFMLTHSFIDNNKSQVKKYFFNSLFIRYLFYSRITQFKYISNL